MRKIAALLLTFAMLLSLTTVPAYGAGSGNKKSFEDIQGHWGRRSVERWAGYGVLKGDEKGAFHPDQEMTRAEFASMLVNLMGYTEKGRNRFHDVPDDAWYADAILKLAAAGVMEGDGINANPNATISRQEAAVLLCRSMALKPSDGARIRFADSASVASWAEDAVAALYERGMIDGVGNNTFAPAWNITRASVAKMVDNMVDEYVVDSKQTITGEVKGIVIVTAESSVTVKDATLKENLIVSPQAEKTSLLLSGKTTAEQLLLYAPDMEVTVNRTASAGEIQVEGEKAELTMYGDAGSITTGEAAAGARITVANNTTVEAISLAGMENTLKLTGSVDALSVYGENNTLTISGTAGDVLVAEAASGAKVTMSSSAKITSLQTWADKLSVTGGGTVKNMKVLSGKSVSVAREVTVSKLTNEGGSSVTVAGRTVAQGKTASNVGYVDNTSSSGGSSGPSYADLVRADLFDAREKPRAAEGSFVPADAIISGYDVRGIPGTSNGVTTVAVAITGTHLMQHQAGNDALGYWVGLGIPHVEGNTYVQRYGPAPADASAITGYGEGKDGTVDSNGKTYYTYYFDVSKGTDGADGAHGYVAVKNGEKVTVYDVDFSKVTTAANIENMRVFVVKDKESYGKLPADYLKTYPWRDEYAIDHQGGSACQLPWLAVVYDSNVPGEFDMEVFKDNQKITEQATNGSTSGKNTINTQRFQSWHLATPTGELSGRDTLSQTDIYGTYAVALTKGEQTARVQAELYQEPGKTYYDITFNFGDGVTPSQTIQVQAGKIVVPPDVPTWSGYQFVNWKNTESHVVLEKGTTSATASVTYTAQWAAAAYTLHYDNGGADGDADGGAGKDTPTKSVAFGTPYGPLPEVTKSGYTLKGWYTAAEGGTEVTRDTVMGAGDVTIYARWEPATIISAAEVPFTLGEQGEAPYPLYQFNYQRLTADQMEIKLEVRAGEQVVYRYTDTPASVNTNAFIQWSLRELTPADDGADSPTGEAAVDIERANDRLIPAGTELVYTITAALNGNTAAFNGTVTDEMVRNVWFHNDDASAPDPKTEQDIHDALRAFSAGAVTSANITLTNHLVIPEGKTLTLDTGTTLTSGVAVTGRLAGAEGAKLVLSADNLYRGLPKGSYVWTEGAWRPEGAVALTAKPYDYSSHEEGKRQYITYTLTRPGDPVLPLAEAPVQPVPFLIAADTVKAIGQKTADGIVMRNLYTTGAETIPEKPNVELSPEAEKATAHNSGWTLVRGKAAETQVWYFWTKDDKIYALTVEVPKEINTQAEWGDTLIDQVNSGNAIPKAPVKP